jgi:hypothetical protein
MGEQKKVRAWLVPVRTRRLGASDDVLTMYVAGFDEAVEAVAAVKQHIRALEGDDVGQPSPISEETATALGVAPSRVWML